MEVTFHLALGALHKLSPSTDTTWDLDVGPMSDPACEESFRNEASISSFSRRIEHHRRSSQRKLYIKEGTSTRAWVGPQQGSVENGTCANNVRLPKTRAWGRKTPYIVLPSCNASTANFRCWSVGSCSSHCSAEAAATGIPGKG